MVWSETPPATTTTSGVSGPSPAAPGKIPKSATAM